MRLLTSPRRRRAALLLTPAVVMSVAVGLPSVANADHPTQSASPANAPDRFAQSGGSSGVAATWEFLTKIPTGNPHSDLDFFTKGKETYAAVGTFAAGANEGGVNVVKLTQDGQVTAASPRYVGGLGSAACLNADGTQGTGLQHDIEATPKGVSLNNDSALPAAPEDVQLLVDATDGTGRCHDQGTLGASGVPRGGLEIIDVASLSPTAVNPVELALTSHVGQAHTVNIDPKRPHIAYAVTSDTVSVTRNADGTFTRNNEIPGGGQRFNLDGFEVVDMSSCLYKTAAVPAGTLDEGIKALPAAEQVAAKRKACQPQVYRYRYDSLAMVQGTTEKGNINGCHELAFFGNDRLSCGSGTAALVFDMSGAFTPEGKPKGTPLDCRRRESSSTAPGGFKTGALVTDCVQGGVDGMKSLDIPTWLRNQDEQGLPKERLEGVKYLGSQPHLGRAATAGFVSQVPATEDIDFNHETEYTKSGRFLLATDERGGGIAGGSQCSQGGTTPPFANGGVSAFRVDRLYQAPAVGARVPGSPEAGMPLTRAQTDLGYARMYTTNTATPLAKSIYRAPIRTGAEPTFCTAHVMQQVPDQTRIFMGWYTQGTQVVDYVELPGGRLQFLETGFAIQPEANTWVSHVFKTDKNADGTFTYYGATGEINRGSIDVYKVTMAAPLTACDLKAGTPERSGDSTVTDRGQSRGVHVENVDCVLNYKISSGKTVDGQGNPTTYAPTERVTRGQMASFIANALVKSRDDDAVLPAAGSDQFSDIASNTHRAAINRLARAGIVKGLTGPGGRFAPEQLISRDQMASFIVEAARFANKDTSYEPVRLDAFGDVPAGNVHERNINAGSEAGLFQGTKAAGTTARSGLFEPRTQVQRDQMATFLVKLFTESIR